MKALELRNYENLNEEEKNVFRIALRDNMKNELMQIKDIETGVDYLNKVKAIQVWAKAEKKDAELQNIIGEQKLRTQKTLGFLVQKGQDEGKIQSQGGSNKKQTDQEEVCSVTDLGLTHKNSSTFKKIASLPDEIFEKEIETAKAETNKRIELTTSRMLNAFKSYEKAQKKQEWQDIVEADVKTNQAIDIYKTNKSFRVIYADPAWSYNDKKRGHLTGGADDHYGTMNIKEIKNLPIEKISEKNSVLFLWATSPLLPEALDVISSWGYKYKTSFVWDKVKHNMGHYNSVRHEFLLLATKGSCTPDNNILFDSVQTIERNYNHSEKPIEFMNIIDELYTYGNKIELFSRKIKKDNWFGWGNEL